MDGCLATMVELNIYFFGSEEDNSIFNKIRYLVTPKSGISYVVSCSYRKIKIDSGDYLSLEKTEFLIKIIIRTVIVY